MMPAAPDWAGQGCRAPGTASGRFYESAPYPMYGMDNSIYENKWQQKKCHMGIFPYMKKNLLRFRMKTDYEKAIEWLNKRAEKAGGITNLGRRWSPGLDVFSVCSRADRLPEPTKLLDWISQLWRKIDIP